MGENELQVIDRRLQPEESSVSIRDDSPSAAIMMAMQKGYTPEFIEKMMDLQERHERNEARKAFYDAVATFKAEAPPVKKDKHNKYFDSWYTSLGNLQDTYNPVLGKHGLSVSFPIHPQENGKMTVECRLSHALGHSESITMTAPIDQAAIGRQSGQRSRNAIQDIRSTFTYLRSMTYEAVLGVSGTEASVDDDGNNAEMQYITTDQAIEITDKISETNTDAGKFLKYLSDHFKMDVDNVQKIPLKGYKVAIAALKAKEGKK